MRILYHGATYKFVWDTKLLAFCYRTKYLFNSLSECPTRSSYHLSQALPISSSITPPLLSLPCKGTRTLLRTLTLFSPYSLKMFICLVQATAHTSILSLTCQPTWWWPVEDPGQGAWACWLTQSDTHTEHSTASKVLAVFTLSFQLSAGWPEPWGSFAKKPALQLHAALDAQCTMRNRFWMHSAEDQRAEWTKNREVRAGRWVLWVVGRRQIGMCSTQYFVNQSKGFDTISYSILLEKLAAHGFWTGALFTG